MTKKRLVSILILVLVSVLGLNLLRSASTTAQFDANDLIDDWLFDSVGTMNTPQIDAFLNNNFPNSCLSTNNGFTAPDPIGYSSSTGYTYGANVSAGRVINDAAQSYGVNPQVILATLEKESSVVTGNASYHCQYINTAMGYGCSDSGPCPGNPSTQSGFSKQVINATWLLKFGEQRSKGNVDWAEIHGSWDNSDDLSRCYGGPMTQGVFKRCRSDSQPVSYDGLITIDGQSVHMDTGATAALYWYTPHFHGNQLFVSIFEGWFGGTTGEGYTLATSAADNGDLRQWVVQKGKRYYVTPEIKQAWGLPDTPIQWAGTYLGSFPDGPPLGRLMRPTGTLDVYFVDDSHCYKILGPDMFNAWNFSPGAIEDVSVGLGRLPSNLGSLTYSIKNSSGTIFMVDGGNKRQYADNNILQSWEGPSASRALISASYLQAMGEGPLITTNKAIYGGKYFFMFQGRAYVTVDPNIAAAWGIRSDVTMSHDISPLFIPYVMLTRFVSSAVDSRLFVVENGVLYHLSPDHAHNLGLTPNTPMIVVNPEAITASISPWSWVMVHDASGKQYVIDGGTKHSFNPDGKVQASWTDSGNVASPQVTNGFLNLLPNSGTIEREIKGSAAPVYMVQGIAKRWVQNPSTAAAYAPIQQVNDSLINTLPNGPNL